MWRVHCSSYAYQSVYRLAVSADQKQFMTCCHLLEVTVVSLGNMLHTAEQEILVFCKASQPTVEHNQPVSRNLKLRFQK